MNASPKADATLDATRVAQQDTVLSPRFYTTDFDELDKTDVAPVRAEWDALIAELRSDPNKKHFVRTDEFDADFSNLPAGSRQGVSRFSHQLDHCGIFRLRPLRRDEEARQKQGHPRPLLVS